MTSLELAEFFGVEASDRIRDLKARALAGSAQEIADGCLRRAAALGDPGLGPSGLDELGKKLFQRHGRDDIR